MSHLATKVLQHGKKPDLMSPPEDSRPRSRSRTLLVGALMLVVLAACGDDDATDSSTTSSSSPTGSTSSSSSTPSTTSQTASDLTGTWVGTWAIDPPYAGVVGGFTMEVVQTGDSFNGTVELTNTDCSNGTVSGTLAGTTIDFGWLLSSEPVQFTGELNGTSMSGTWAAAACSDPNISLTGTWEATKP